MNDEISLTPTATQPNLQLLSTVNRSWIKAPAVSVGGTGKFKLISAKQREIDKRTKKLTEINRDSLNKTTEGIM